MATKRPRGRPRTRIDPALFEVWYSDQGLVRPNGWQKTNWQGKQKLVDAIFNKEQKT